MKRFCSKFKLDEGKLKRIRFLSGEEFLQGFIEFSPNLYGALPRRFMVLNRVPSGLILDVTDLFPRWGELPLLNAKRIADRYGGIVKEIIDSRRGKRLLVVITPPDCIIIDVKTMFSGGG